MDEECLGPILSSQPYTNFIKIHPNYPKYPNNLLSDLTALTNFYNFKFSTSPPTRKHSIINKCALDGPGSYFYHTLRFLEFKLFKTEKELFDNRDEFLSNIIDELSNIAISSIPFRISVKVDEVLEYCDIKNNETVKRLTLAYEARSSMLLTLPIDMNDKEEVNREIGRVVETVSHDINLKSNIAKPHPLESYLMYLLMTNCLPYGTMIKNLLKVFDSTPTDVFQAELCSSVAIILGGIMVRGKKRLGVSVIIFRYIFEQLYLKTKGKMKYQRDVEKCTKLLNVTMDMISIPEEFSPKCDGKDFPRDVFNKNEDFKNAIDCVEELLFVVSPFDILNCTQRAVDCIDKAASKMVDFSMPVFPFEVTFSLFVGVVLASDVIDMSTIVPIADEYLPINGLTSHLEYARAKIMAVSEELSMITKRKL